MRRTLIAIVVGFAVAACSASSDAAPPAPEPSGQATKIAPSLAKTKLKEATAAALKWKSDAVLIQVAARNIGTAGTALDWDYGFYSKSALTCLVVNLSPAVRTTESGGPLCESPALTGDFIDSDRAITIARASGITHATATMVLSVSPRSKAPNWSVMDDRGMKPGNVMLDIDGISGKVTHKTTQK